MESKYVFNTLFYYISDNLKCKNYQLSTIWYPGFTIVPIKPLSQQNLVLLHKIKNKFESQNQQNQLSNLCSREIVKKDK